MTVFDAAWFAIAIIIIAIVLVIDPKSTLQNSNNMAGVFESSSSGQQFIYKLSAVLIATFYVLTIYLNFV